MDAFTVKIREHEAVVDAFRVSIREHEAVVDAFTVNVREHEVRISKTAQNALGVFGVLRLWRLVLRLWATAFSFENDLTEALAFGTRLRPRVFIFRFTW